MIDLVSGKDKDHYRQVFLEECKYVAKENKASKFITDDIENSSHDSDREENSSEENWL